MNKIQLGFLFIFFNIAVYAQFDKKLTFNVFAGTTLPLGDKLNADQVPYVFPNFKNGLQLGAGGQYNFTPRFSVGLNAIALYAINYTNPIAAPSSKQEIIDKEQQNYKTSVFTNYSLGIALKFKLLRQARFNPYIFGELNANYYQGEIAPRLQYYQNPDLGSSDPNTINDKYTVLRFNAKNIDPTFAIGSNLGLGIDIKLNDTFTLMLQSGYQFINTMNDKNLNSNINYIGFQGGVRFSVLKSKSIL